MKSLIDYILQNVADVTYNRVIAAAQKYPGYSVFEYQHGINSKASQEYRRRHPPEEPEIPEEEFEPEYEPEPELRIFCFRDYLGEDRFSYYGVNLYFAERYQRDFFTDVQDHFKEELETYMGMEYEKTPISECDAGDIDSPDEELVDGAFVFEISDLKHQRFAYWGQYHRGKFTSLHMFDDFDMQTLKILLRTR